MPRLAFTPQQLAEKRLRAAEGLQSEAQTHRIDALLSKPHQPSYELHFLSVAPNGAAFLFGTPLMPYNWSMLKEKGIQYVFLIDALCPQNDAFLNDLQKNADRIMTFSPYRDSNDLTLHDPLPMTGGPFLWNDILPRVRDGYPVSIYKIRS